MELPVGYWSNEVFSKVASAVRKPLYTEHFTTAKYRVSYARIDTDFCHTTVSYWNVEKLLHEEEEYQVTKKRRRRTKKKQPMKDWKVKDIENKRANHNEIEDTLTEDAQQAAIVEASTGRNVENNKVQYELEIANIITLNSFCVLDVHNTYESQGLD
ncbi:hypothetical protein HAX54_033463 [Datura stramonium]|uniref:DUF4283 domain-containing protein n=1 Tax=Datura stramonium TaxID=4076 RepID=A0ABS8VDT5_DATST|nr:hypothetical protein [Datura stramonium]